MIYTLKNDYLTVQINKKGATLWSIKDHSDTEYLWQGDPTYWEDRALTIFPYIARLTNGEYTLKDKTYKMDIHGFAKDASFEVEQKSDTQLVFTIKSTDETYKCYPYNFLFSVIYKLENNKLVVTYIIRNNDDKTMYFGVGGHPGFNVPFEKNTVFEDYYLQFDEVCDVKRVDFSDDCFFKGSYSPFLLENGDRLTLNHELFDDDAIILCDMAKGVTLTSNLTDKSIRVTYPNMTYLGIWHMRKTDAPYICIEPWSSLPSRKGIVEDLEKQPNLVALESTCEYENEWCIEVFNSF